MEKNVLGDFSFGRSSISGKVGTGEWDSTFNKEISDVVKKGASSPGLIGAYYKVDSNGTKEEKTSVKSVTFSIAAEGKGDSADSAASIAVTLGAIAFGMAALAV